MRCAIDCIKILIEHYEINEEKAIKLLDEVENKINEQGLSIYDFITLTNKYYLHCIAKKSMFFPKQLPCVIYLKGKRTGHYMMLMKKEHFHFIVYDPSIEYKRIHKIWLYLYWSHICILCYNETKEVRNESKYY